MSPHSTVDVSSLGPNPNALPQELIDILRESAKKAREFSYSPYSKFRVGAALLSKTGNLYLGCNVENASYGGAICAERTAFVKAVSQGDQSMIAVGVITDKEKCVGPCGFCRQFMVEFGKNLLVYQFSATTDEFVVNPLSSLLPDSFGPEDL